MHCPSSLLAKVCSDKGYHWEHQRVWAGKGHPQLCIREGSYSVKGKKERREGQGSLRMGKEKEGERQGEEWEGRSDRRREGKKRALEI